MSARSYLSIGDVLTLLRQEFPDVTISKIRFLESQGLVNPERTPSGYRKFYEHDVERLRWVLRQQRENFLPLKVIKDRLDDEGDEAAAPADAASIDDDHHHAGEEPVLVGQRASAEVGESAVGGGAERPADEPVAPPRPTGSPLPGIEGGSASTNGTPSAGGARTPSPDGAVAAAPTRPAASRRPAPAAAAATGVTPSARPTAPAAAPSAPSAASGRSHKGTATAGSARPAAGSATGDPVTPSGRTGSDPTPAAGGPPAPPSGSGGSASPAGGPASAPATAGGRSKGSRGASPPPGAEPPEAPPGGPIASLSIEELSAASGLDVSVLEELVDFGLLSGTRVVGHVYFDDEALAVAKLAAGFARFGVEPRHLRLYKNAADREAGFVEQIVIPLVRQRNPEARVRAHETVDELAALGQQLRASLLRSALGTLLDG